MSGVFTTQASSTTSVISTATFPFWDGEDETFDVESAEDVALLPDLKKVRLLGAPSGELLAQFRARGIEVL